jgi:hydroxymethylglutaryl-CoA lyase
LSKKIQIIEVGLRDGLQNEANPLDLSTRLQLAKKLSKAGIRRMEIGAFVSPVWVPQMAGSDKLIKKALRMKAQGTAFTRATEFSALVPNKRGMEDAIESGIKEVAIFGAVSESFSQNNINCSVNESLKRFEPVIDLAKKKKIKVRGYLSTVFGCPFEGKVSPASVAKLSKIYFDMGVYELSLGDTNGVATPSQVEKVMNSVSKVCSTKSIALHFHDTRGLALSNIMRGLDCGVRIFDSSIGGLGGCPYAPGASGNVATEEVIHLLHSLGYKTGVDVGELIKTARWVEGKIGHPLPSKLAKAGLFESK